MEEERVENGACTINLTANVMSSMVTPESSPKVQPNAPRPFAHRRSFQQNPGIRFALPCQPAPRSERQGQQPWLFPFSCGRTRVQWHGPCCAAIIPLNAALLSSPGRLFLLKGESWKAGNLQEDDLQSSLPGFLPRDQTTRVSGNRSHSPAHDRPQPPWP